MINLLPDDMKSQISAARVNIILVRYIFVIILAFMFLVLVQAGSYYLLDQSRKSAEQLIEANSIKADVYSETKTELEELNNSLTATKTILDQEIFYSKVLTGIAQMMPPGTVIEKISLTAEAFSRPMTMTVYAKTTEDVVAARDRFQQSSLFSSVSFEAISGTSGINDYPVSATVNLTLNPGAI